MDTTNQTNIFIVDDNKIFTLALKADIENAFVDMPVKVQSFETGEKCMEKFKEEQPQVVILDYHLNSKYPDAADGIKVLDWIKKENPETNVIILSVDDNIDIALKSFQHGASDYVVKTETQFRKINYSLINLFKIMEAKSYERRYKYLVVGVFICIALLVGAVIAMQIFNHS
jgi:DNA-binding NarL/FixJ family response regulator